MFLSPAIAGFFSFSIAYPAEALGYFREVRCADSSTEPFAHFDQHTSLPTAYCLLPYCLLLSSPAAMLAIVFRFPRSAFARLPRALERYELASIFLDSISVRTVIGAPVAATRGDA